MDARRKVDFCMTSLRFVVLEHQEAIRDDTNEVFLGDKANVGLARYPAEPHYWCRSDEYSIWQV